MSGLLKPSSDFVFANLFGVEKHKKALICLLNAILKGKPHIKSITLLNPQHKKQRKDGKTTTLDIKAEIDNGTIVDIEIQCERDGNLVNRANFHQARMMKDELNSGESYESCPNIISIWITDYHETTRNHHTHEAVYMFKENHVKGVKVDDIQIASEKTRIFIIELPKIDLRQATLNDLFSVWMFFLKNPELIPDDFLTKVPEVHEALEELKVMSLDEEFRAEYNAYIKAQNDRRSREANARADGRVEGLAEGEAIGEARGELKKAREIAIGLLQSGVDADVIARASGLSIEEIKSLMNK
jgi:predicted transposase/invertase (TIGR01784 family)